MFEYGPNTKILQAESDSNPNLIWDSLKKNTVFSEQIFSQKIKWTKQRFLEKPQFELIKPIKMENITNFLHLSIYMIPLFAKINSDTRKKSFMREYVLP